MKIFILVEGTPPIPGKCSVRNGTEYLRIENCTSDEMLPFCSGWCHSNYVPAASESLFEVGTIVFSFPLNQVRLYVATKK